MKDRKIIGASELFEGEPGETLPEVVVVCKVLGGIEGVIIDQDGNPIPHVDVECTGELPEGGAATCSATTDFRGAFSMAEALPEGVYSSVQVECHDEFAEYTAVIEDVQIVADAVIDLGLITALPTSSTDPESGLLDVD